MSEYVNDGITGEEVRIGDRAAYAGDEGIVEHIILPGTGETVEFRTAFDIKIRELLQIVENGSSSKNTWSSLSLTRNPLTGNTILPNFLFTPLKDSLRPVDQVYHYDVRERATPVRHLELWSR